jgi:phosphoribosylcarboxyaminoimidazole (NCAIR) mutase
LVIGVPIKDSKTNGLSSILSTSEKPPRNPVLTVGLNDTYSALLIAYRFMKREFNDKLVIATDINLDGRRITEETIKNHPVKGRVTGILSDAKYDQEHCHEVLEKLKKSLDGLGLPYDIRKRDASLSRDDIVITLSGDRMPSGTCRKIVGDIDNLLKKGKGIQIVVNYRHSATSKTDLSYSGIGHGGVTGFVGVQAYQNAAWVAAQFLGYEPALETMILEKVKKRESLESHRGLLVKGGEVTKL